MTPQILTGIDLPYPSPGGSVELLLDLYARPGAPLTASTFMLRPGSSAAAGLGEPHGMWLLEAPGKCADGPGFDRYTAGLREEILRTFPAVSFDAVHLQHLAFGATAALIGAYPEHPRLALVHGTDLLFAATNSTQHRVVALAAHAADLIAVPTLAMADILRRLVPTLDPARIAHIPWGIPDRLLTDPPPRPPRTGGPLRLLYAGRLDAEKGVSALAASCAAIGAALSIAAPPGQYAAVAAALAAGSWRPDYLGWLPRPRLWEEFARHDLLAVPSTTLEAFGLAPVEAQACGLPVLYQPVAGLIGVLGESGLPVDLRDPAALAGALAQLEARPEMLEELRQRGRANAARFPLSATARALAQATAGLAANARRTAHGADPTDTLTACDLTRKQTS